MLVIPDWIWTRTIQEFGRIRAEVERVAYFDGFAPTADFRVVTTLTIPNAQLDPLRYQVSPDAMSEAGRHLRAHQMLRLAQVHTHPDDRTGHSPWDDRRAYSQVDGAISIVLPYHAKHAPTLRDGTVHLRTSAGWKRLAPQDAARHVSVVPSFLDFRR